MDRPDDTGENVPNPIGRHSATDGAITPVGETNPCYEEGEIDIPVPKRRRNDPGNDYNIDDTRSEARETVSAFNRDRHRATARIRDDSGSTRSKNTRAFAAVGRGKFRVNPYERNTKTPPHDDDAESAQSSIDDGSQYPFDDDDTKSQLSESQAAHTRMDTIEKEFATLKGHIRDESLASTMAETQKNMEWNKAKHSETLKEIEGLRKEIRALYDNRKTDEMTARIKEEIFLEMNSQWKENLKTEMLRGMRLTIQQEMADQIQPLQEELAAARKTIAKLATKQELTERTETIQEMSKEGLSNLRDSLGKEFNRKNYVTTEGLPTLIEPSIRNLAERMESEKKKSTASINSINAQINNVLERISVTELQNNESMRTYLDKLTKMESITNRAEDGISATENIRGEIERMKVIQENLSQKMNAKDSAISRMTGENSTQITEMR